MKKRVRLTESDLHSLIKESVKKVLREYGSDGPDEVYFDYGDPNQDDSYRELDPSVDFDWMNDLEYYPEAPEGSDEYVPSASDYDNFDDMVESKGRMGRIIRESIKKVLNEGLKDVDPGNVVPQEVAEHYGFRREYAGFKNGLELWGKDIGEEIDAGCTTPRAVSLLRKLGIKRFTTYNYKGKVRITVQPNQKPRPMHRGLGDDYAPPKNNPWGRSRKRLGDYYTPPKNNPWG